MIPSSPLALLADSCAWAKGPGDVVAALPAVAAGLPPLTWMEEAADGPAFLAPCTAALLEPVATHTLALVRAELDGRPVSSPTEAALVPLLARLVLEGGRGSLRAGAVPGLVACALALATVRGGRAVLGGLPAGVASNVRSLREQLAAADPTRAGQALRRAAERLRLTLDGVSEAVVTLAPLPPGADLPRALLEDGLLLALGRGEREERHLALVAAATGQSLSPATVRQVLLDPDPGAAGPAGALARALRRWDVSLAVIDHLALLTPSSNGGWLGPGGMLPDSPATRFLVPRGGAPRRAFVVALRLDALQARMEAVAAQGSPVAPVEAAFGQLAADAAGALHVRLGSYAISAFADGLSATAFAERGTRTLSGPRLLAAGSLAPTVEIDASVQVAAGVALGELWGGTDGRQVELDGAVVGRAIQLASTRPPGLEELRGIARGPGGGVHCDEATVQALLAEAAAEGRPVVDRAAGMGPPLGSLPVRGWWESRGRRMVLVGRSTAGLVPMEAPQVEALLDLAGEEATVSAEETSVEGVYELPRRTHAAGGRRGGPSGRSDPLAVEALIAEGIDSHDEPTGDERTQLTEAGPRAAARRRPSPADELTDIFAQAPAGSRAEEEAQVVPAWDATGFSLPEYSQEINAADLLAPTEVATDPQSYSLEVDDDYGFEEELGRPAAPRERAPSLDSVSRVDPVAHARPGSLFAPAPPIQHGAPPSRLDLADLDVFAWPEGGGEDGYADPPQEGEPRDRGEEGHEALDTAYLAVKHAEVAIEDEEWGDEDDGADSTARTASHSGVEVGTSDGGARSDPPGRTVVPPRAPAVSGEPSLGPTSAGSTTSGAPVGVAGVPVVGTAVVASPEPPPRRAPSTVVARQLAGLFDGYVVVSDEAGCFTFGLRDGHQIRDAHSFETGGDGDAAYRAFVQAKVAEGFVPRLDLWSPLPTEGRPVALDPTLLERAYTAMLTGTA
ncbi:hypothetical protein L6R53_22835 [Myxococcota bacterium]|nr:hypothetical protein [Myxococcota bacterium]